MAVFEKNGNWWIDTYVKGKRVRRKIGPDKETAELVEKDLQVKAAKGEYLGIVEERKILFKDFAKEYLEWSKVNKAEKTVKFDRGTIQGRFIPFFQGKYLAGITTKDVEDFKAFRASTLKPRSVNRELGLLRAMLSRACEWQYLRSSPAKGVKELKYQKRPPTYLTLGQLDRSLIVCRYQHLYTFVVLAAYTGMRRGEILCLKWEDVNSRRREIAIRQKTKSYLPRTVPMADLVVQALKRHPRHITSDLVLSRDNGNPYNDITKSFYSALKEADLPRIRLHDLRHSFASNLVAAGAPLNVVQELMGHKDIKTTMIYAHLAPNAKGSAVDLLMKRQIDVKEEGQKQAIEG